MRRTVSFAWDYQGGGGVSNLAITQVEWVARTLKVC